MLANIDEIKETFIYNSHTIQSRGTVVTEIYKLNQRWERSNLLGDLGAFFTRFVNPKPLMVCQTRFLFYFILFSFYQWCRLFAISLYKQNNISMSFSFWYLATFLTKFLFKIYFYLCAKCEITNLILSVSQILYVLKAYFNMA
jgi:hypothetical protein